MSQRFLLYSHDTYGLGHLRRNITVAAALVAERPDVEVLLVSGSPRSGSFSLPPRTDIVQLPSVTKSPSGDYQPRRLVGGLDNVVELRSAVIDATIRTYRPDVMVVDHAPAGMGGELLPVLGRMALDPLRPRLVLGLREIIDDACRVAQEWTRNGAWDALGNYDDVVVYGDQSVPSTATELGLEQRLGRPVTHVGYCGPVDPASDRRQADEAPLVVVTVGGGGDGQAVCHRYLDYVETCARTESRSVIVTGPLMSSRRRTCLERRAASLPRPVEIRAFEPEMRNLLNSADAVISMGGYNTVVELLAGGVPSLIVPRTSPRLEQQLRIDRLQSVSHLVGCRIEGLTSRRIDEFVRTAVDRPRHPITIDLDGAATVSRLLAASVRMEPVAIRG